MTSSYDCGPLNIICIYLFRRSAIHGYASLKFQWWPRTTLQSSYGHSRPSLALRPVADGQWPTDVLPPASREIRFTQLFCQCETVNSAKICKRYLKSGCYRNPFRKTLKIKTLSLTRTLNPDSDPNLTLLTNPTHPNWHRIACITRCCHSNTSHYSLNKLAYTVGIADLWNNGPPLIITAVVADAPLNILMMSVNDIWNRYHD